MLASRCQIRQHRCNCRDASDATRFLDRCCPQGVRAFPGRSTGHLSGGADDCGRRRQGGKADIAKPLKGLGSGVMEIALPHRGNAYRVVYAVQIGADLWVVHAFQKKSPEGIKTPKHEIDLVAARLKRLKEMLR